MIYLSLIFVIVVHFVLFSKRRFADPVSVFFLAFLYYSYLTPIVFLNFTTINISFSGPAIWVTRSIIDNSAILFAVGYSGFALSYFLLSKRSANLNYVEEELNFKEIVSDRYIRILIITLFIITFVILLFFQNQFSAATESYEGKILNNYNSASYSFIMNTALTIFSILANYTILKSKKFVVYTIVFIVFFIAISILSFSKGPLIYAALAAFCAMHRLKQIPYAMLFLGLVFGAAVITLLFLPMFSVYRATGMLEIQAIDARSLSLFIGEASSPYNIVSFALYGYVDTNGQPLWQSFMLWIPQAIWVDRPLDIAESFAREVMTDWKAGYGLGFSIFAEAVARSGLWGSFFFMALVGACMALIQSLFARLLPEEMRMPATLTIGGIVSILVLRGTFSGLFTQSLQNWVPIVLISLIASKIAYRKRAKRSSRRIRNIAVNAPPRS